MTKFKIIIGALLLALTATFAKQTSTITTNLYWYRNAQYRPDSVRVEFRCFPNGIGCLGVFPPSLAKQLYTDSTLLVPLRH